MGGKTSTSTSQVSIPPEVLARYNSVNATAEQVAQTPFQQYSTNPNAFVQPLTPTQQAGIQNTNSAAGMAQPYFQAGTGFALAGAQPINAQPLDISSYMNPYLGTVLGSTEAMVNQQNQQAQAGQTANAINQGYFGGDRAGIAAAVLQGQQELAGGQLYSGIASDAFQQALAAAQQQQGVGLGAAQANRAALQQTGESLAGLGTGAQGAALTGAQAQLGAGQVEQQTGQAGLTALYNQFLQQQSYPFQTAQFLANIAEGTGALSGSTTTQTQPGGLLASDERLKEDMEPIGQGFDGANIYRFRYRGDPTVRIGFSAQEIERLHPEAVAMHPSGFLMVDYGRATEAAAGFARAANDNLWDDEPRRMRAAGGRVERQAGGMSGWGMYPGGTNPMVIQQLLESQAQMYAPYSGQGGPGLYGSSASATPHGGQGYVPQATLPVGQLQIARPVAAPQGGLAQDIHAAASLADDAEGLSKDYHFGHEMFDKARGWVTGSGSGGGGGGDSGGGDEVNKVTSASGGRVARQGGGGLGDWWDAVTGSPQAAAAANRRLLAHNAAIRAAQAQQRAHPAAAPPHQPSGFESSGAPPTDNLRFGVANDPNAGRWGLGDAARAVAGLNWTGGVDPIALAGAGLSGHDLPMPPRPGVAAPAGHAPLVGAPAPRATPVTPPSLGTAMAPRADPRFFGSTPTRADLIRHHTQQAQAHADVAQQLAAGDQGRETMPLTLGNLGREPDPASTTPINIGDVSNLQGGFAPANLQQPHEGLFHRIGDWFAGHFGNDAQREAYDARAPLAAAPIQSAAFQPTPNGGLTHDQWLAGVQPTSAPAAVQPRAPPDPGLTHEQWMAGNAAPAPAVAAPPPIQSAAVQPRAHPDDLVAGVDANPVLAAAYGGFARARGGTANPWSAEVSGLHNTDRVARDLGGGADPSNPQNDDPYHPQGPGLNIPTAETQHAKLATAQPVGGQGGGGLGQAIGMGSDIANIGMAMSKFLPFIGLATGGRAGYADGGDPAPQESSPAEIENWPAPVAQQEEQQHPQWVTPQIIAKAAGAREKPLVRVNPPPDDSTPAPTTPAPAVHDPTATPAAAAADDDGTALAAASQPQPGLGGANTQGRGGGFGGMLRNIIGAPIHMLGDLAGYEGGGRWNKDQLIPFVTGLADMLAAPTKYPLVALTQGLKGGAQQYMTQQQQEATLAQEQATAGQMRFQTLPPSLQKGMVEADGPALDPTTHQIDWKNTHIVPGVGYKHWEIGTNMMGSAMGQPSGGAGGAPQAGVAGSPGSAGPGKVTGAITADYSGGASPHYTLGPSQREVANAVDLYGINPNGTGMENTVRRGMGVGKVQVTDQQVADAGKNADQYDGNLNDASTTHRALLDSVGQIQKLAETGPGAVGPGQEERQLALSSYNMMLRVFGLKPDPSIDDNTTATTILGKLQALQGAASASQYGQHAASIATQLSSVMPSGHMTKPAAYNLLSQMLVANQQDRDFANYRAQYQRLGLGDFQAFQAFHRDFDPMYAKEGTQLQSLMARGPKGGPSVFEVLQQHPEDIQRFEQGWTDANGTHHNGFGYLGRYLQ